MSEENSSSFGPQADHKKCVNDLFEQSRQLENRFLGLLQRFRETISIFFGSEVLRFSDALLKNVCKNYQMIQKLIMSSCDVTIDLLDGPHSAQQTTKDGKKRL